MGSRAHPRLRGLQPGEDVPSDVYVLDYQDGTRPRWTVVERRGGKHVILLVLADRGGIDLDLLEGERQVAVTVITGPRRTLRSQPHLLGGGAGNRWCDMDQQARAAVQDVACGRSIE